MAQKSVKENIEQILADGRTVQIEPHGWSMYPLLVPGRDQAIIAPAEPEKMRRGDVVLYRREQGILVLHRIWKVTPEGFYMVGDNQSKVEGPLRPCQIKGRLTAVIRNGREILMQNPLSIFLARFWLLLRPVRGPLSAVAHRLRQIWQAYKKG